MRTRKRRALQCCGCSPVRRVRLYRVIQRREGGASRQYRIDVEAVCPLERGSLGFGTPGRSRSGLNRTGDGSRSAFPARMVSGAPCVWSAIRSFDTAGALRQLVRQRRRYPVLRALGFFVGEHNLDVFGHPGCGGRVAHGDARRGLPWCEHRTACADGRSKRFATRPPKRPMVARTFS